MIGIFFLAPSKGWGDAPVQNPTILGLYSEGAESLIYNHEGIVPTERQNYYFSVDLSYKVAPLELFIQPLFTMNENTRGTIHKGYLRLKTSRLHVDIGKESLWWGQGTHGGLFLTNNAKPLPMIRVFNPNPTILPSIFRYLGPFQFDIFFSQLEEDRVIPKPYFQGTRLVFKPHQILDIGLTRTIMMGGKGRPGINFSKFITIWFGENKETTQDELSNSIAGIDFRLTFPKAQFYGEIGGEDEAGGYPSKDAFLLGIYLPENDFRIEYADITNPAWYVHSTYQSGYTYKGRILGHHLGGGGKDLFFKKGVVKKDQVVGAIHLDYEERGITTQPVTERHYQAGTDWNFNVGKIMIPWTAHIAFAYDWVSNAGYTSGKKEENALFQFAWVGQL